MTEILDRVAESMADKTGLVWALLPDGRDSICGHGMPEGCKDHWVRLARAAIEAMREPTPVMLKAAPNLMKSMAKKDWQAMIDAALGDTHS
jgi:hypothetical protein